MIIIKLISVVVCGLFISVLMKNFNQAFAPAVALITGLVIICFTLPYIAEIISTLKNIAGFVSGLETYFMTIIKIVVIALIGEFSAQLCADAGENYLTTKIYFATKIIILYQILPVFIRFIKAIYIVVQGL